MFDFYSLKSFIEFSHNKLEKKMEHDYTIISPCQGFYFAGLPAEKRLIWWRLLTCKHQKTKTIQYNYRLRSKFISCGQSLQRNWYWFYSTTKIAIVQPHSRCGNVVHKIKQLYALRDLMNSSCQIFHITRRNTCHAVEKNSNNFLVKHNVEPEYDVSKIY